MENHAEKEILMCKYIGGMFLVQRGRLIRSVV